MRREPAADARVHLAHRQRFLQRRLPDFLLRVPAEPHRALVPEIRSEEHTSELQSLMRISYAVFCLNQSLFTISPFIFPLMSVISLTIYFYLLIYSTLFIL